MDSHQISKELAETKTKLDQSYEDNNRLARRLEDTERALGRHVTNVFMEEEES